MQVYAKNGYNLILSGRRIFEIEAFSEELKSFNITVELKELDITKFDTFTKFISTLKTLPTSIIRGTGYNPATEASNQNKFIEVMDVNYTGPILFINEIKKYSKQDLF